MDHDPGCKGWAAASGGKLCESEEDKAFMLRICPASCGSTLQARSFGSAPARLPHLLSARLAAQGSSALAGCPPATGSPAAASAARASRLQSRRFHRL